MLWLLAALALAEDPGHPPNLQPKDPITAPSLTGASTSISAPASTSALAGTIVERGSGLPLKGTVTVDGVDVPVGPDGKFYAALPPGQHEVVIAEEEEHAPLTETELLRDGEVLTVTYRLERRSWNEAIVVYGEETREEVSREVITAEELKMIPGSFGDPLRGLQSLPGVARPATLEGALVVRGAEAVNTGTYVDEVPIPYLFHFFIGRSVINPALLDDVEFYAGGMPSRFGDVTQAVVNARTLDTKPEPGWHGKVSADLLDFAASGEGRIGDHFTWQAGYRVSWIGAIVGTSARVYAIVKGLGDFRPAYPSLSYEDHLVRVSFEEGADRVVLTWLGARDALIFHPAREDYDGDGDIEDPPLPVDLPYDPFRLMDSGFHRLHLRWDRKVEGREQMTWISAGPDRQASLLQGIGLLADGVDFGRLHGWTFTAKRSDRFPIGKDAVRAGVDVDVAPVAVEDYRHIDANGKIPVTKDTRTAVGGWVEYQHSFGKLWMAPGVRVSEHLFNKREYFEVEPRLTLRNKLADHWTATGFVGRFSQAPPIDRYAEGIGNPHLGLMTAWQASAGVEGRWPSGLEVDLTAYGSRTDHMVTKDQKVVVNENQNVGTTFGGGPTGTASSEVIPVYNDVTGYAFGVESLVRVRPVNDWFGWVALTIGKAIRVSPDGTVRPGDYDLPISFVAVGARQLPWKMRVSGRLRMTSGYPYTPLYGVYLVDEDRWNGFPGEPNSERFPWFKQIDLRVDRTWTGKRARWTLYLDCFNALNTKNWFLASYTPNYSKIVPQIWIPIIPTLGVEVAY